MTTPIGGPAANLAALFAGPAASAAQPMPTPSAPAAQSDGESANRPAKSLSAYGPDKGQNLNIVV